MSAPKQLAKRQKIERKRRRKQEALRRHRQRKQPTALHPTDFFDPVPVACGPIGGIKMSAVLEDFIAPLTELAEDYEAHSNIVSMGVVAWNAALEPEHRRAAFVGCMIDAAMNGATIEDRLTCRELIEDLIARKLQHFANYRRPILSYHLDKLEDGSLYLSVASAVC
jgi:hypothetical protein